MEKSEKGFKHFIKDSGMVILTGVVIGIAALVLTALGNPKNMGFCIACFVRDISGAMNFHRAEVVQYFRPEIVGLVLGALFMALFKKEWRAQGGSSPVTRFLIGVFVMIGALVFLGCPLRMVIRLGGGDLNALVGLVGFVAGILVGIIPLKMGFSLNRAYKQTKVEGLLFPILLAVLFILSVATELFTKSESGPGSMRAPWIASLLIALVVGALCQRSRMCLVGGTRDAVLFKDFRLVYGYIAMLIVLVVGNLILGSFKFGFAEQPVAHTDGVFNFLGMLMVGWGSVLLGGCPLRQLILAGEGNSDSGITVLGFAAGAAVAHNFGLASSAAGIGKGPVLWVLIGGFVFFALISVFNSKRRA